MDQALAEAPRPGVASRFAAFAPAATALLGVSLWAQLAIFGLRNELQAGAQPGRLLLYMLPLAFLAAGMVLKRAVLVLAGFPLGLLPAAVIASQLEAAPFQPWAAGQACLSLAIFLAVGGSWLSSGSVRDGVESVGVATTVAGEYRRHVYGRLVPLLLLWSVPIYAIFWDPAIVGTIAQGHGENALTAQIFIATVLFFAWCVVAYMYYIVPALNLEYDRRRVRRDVRELGEEMSPERARKRFLRSTLLTVVAVVLLLVML